MAKKLSAEMKAQRKAERRLEKHGDEYAKAVAAAASRGLEPLTGTVPQQVWAEPIRDRAMTADPALADAARQHAACSTASFWIVNRFKSGEQLVEAVRAVGSETAQVKESKRDRGAQLDIF
ncbi:MAG: hypothetical protein M0Z99_22095 [Betaproteobacteria bacterium]|nr:hypothetical protein [Betaproteobacteria bacterium]